MANYFLQDFLVVYCCKGAVLIYSVLIQETLFIKKKIIIITFPALLTMLTFLGLVMLKFSTVNSAALIQGHNKTYRTHPQLSHCKIQPLSPPETVCITRYIQQHDMSFVLE